MLGEKWRTGVLDYYVIDVGLLGAGVHRID